jgi:hypothetical protein
MYTACVGFGTFRQQAFVQFAGGWFRAGQCEADLRRDVVSGAGALLASPANEYTVVVGVIMS